MPDKPGLASGYSGGQVEVVRSTCLYAATRLGDLMDETVVVGGLVPSLLIGQAGLPDGAEAHIGTMDLDLGLSLALLDGGRYRALTDRLHDAGFLPDRTADGRVIRQRWRMVDAAGGAGRGTVTVDFLIPPSLAGDQGGRLRDIERDFAAIITPGLELAFRDRRRVCLEGRTVRGEQARREVWACGPGAFVILKALAFLGRGDGKDAYDLFYVVRNFGSGVGDVAACVRPIMAEPAAQRALQVLREDFLFHDAAGPRRTAEFLTGRPDDTIQADVVGFMRALLDRCR